MAIVLVFVDGVGLGPRGASSNPISQANLDILANFLPPGWNPPEKGGRPGTLPKVLRNQPLPFGGHAVATDASLGIEGLPQSATGQTTLLTGVNGGQALGGRHYTGFPTATLKKVIHKHSIFRQIQKNGSRATFLNAFGPGFFAQGESVWEQPYLGATTWANKAGGLPFRSFADLAAGRAIFHDITHDTMPNHSWIAAKDRQPPRTVEDAAKTLVWASQEYDFVLFEFFQTDKAGHSMDADKAVRELQKLEAFLSSSLSLMNLEDCTLLLTSDHGNIEDLSVHTHTLNPVPTLIFGRLAESLQKRLTTLEAFAPAILELVG